MFFDLSIPVPAPASLPQASLQISKKNKGKQPATQAPVNTHPVKFSAAQLEKIESRIDLLVRCTLLPCFTFTHSNKSLLVVGYAVIAFNQQVKSKIDPKSHVNTLDPLLMQLRRRQDIIFLKRLTLLLDEDSEKGTGMVYLLYYVYARTNFIE